MFKNIIFAISLLAVSNAMAMECYVSPKGNDQAAGSRTQPVATLERARDLVRPFAGKEPCTVMLQEGVYRLESPVRFGPQDSGSAAFPVVYKAAPGAKAILSGAQPISNDWKPWKDGIFGCSWGRWMRRIFSCKNL